MADIIIRPSVVPVWDRNTIADGKKMSESLTALSARDECLASYITSAQGDIEDKLRSVSSELHNADVILQDNIDTEGTEREQEDRELQQAIDDEADTREQEDKNLQEQIDKLNAATDVIAVFGTYDDFTAASAGAWQEQVTDNDVIKVLRDSAYNPPSTDPDFESNDDDYFQVYYQWHDADAEIPHTDWTGWSAIGNLDPYYSVAEINDIVDELSATISNTYLSANGEAVQSGHNIVISAHPTEPKIKIETSSHVTFEGISSTNLSATNASGENIKYDYVTAVNLSSTNVSANSLSATTISASELSATKLSANELSATTLSASTAYGQSAKFDDISATHLTALTATGESAKFTYISATNLTALTASGNLAQYITLSGNNIQGVSVTATIDGLINSALSGGAMTGLKNASVLEFQYQDGSTPAAISAELQTTADKITFLPSSGCTDWLKFSTDGYDVGESAQIIKIITPNFQTQIETLDTKKLDKSAFSNWSGSTDSVFSGTSRSAQSAGSASLAYSSTYTYSATTASSAGYAETANSAYSSQSSQNAVKLGGVEAAKYMVSTKLYSNTAGVITAYGNADSKSALGCVGDYVEKSARNCTIGSANVIGTGANDAFAQGYGNSAVDRSFVQGQNCVANYVSLAEGLNSSAINTAMAQGYGNSAYEQSLAQGYYNSAASRSIAVGFKNYAKDGSCSIGSANSAFRDGVSMGDENTASFQSLALGSHNSALNYGLALGYKAISVNDSISVGNNTSADSFAVAVGDRVSADNRSIAIGSNNVTAHNGSLAVGFSLSAYTNSLALGDNNTATNNSETIGENNSAYSYALANGSNNSAYSYSLAQGYGNNAYDSSIAQGYANNAINYSQAFGRGTIVSSSGMALGTYNKTTSAAFVIGNGTSDSNRSDLLTVGHEGYIMLPGKADSGGGKKSITFDSTGLSAVSEGRGYRYDSSSTWLDILNVAQGAYVPLSARACHIGANSNKASFDSLAQGYNASAENDSFAQGNTVYANEESIAQGYGASAKYNSIAQGTNVTACNQGQAFGQFASAYAGFAVNPGIWGTGNVITSACNCGLALGNGCYASGNAVAIGYKTSSYDGFAWGQETRASGNSIAMGAYLNTKDRQIQLGWFGKDKSSYSNASVFSIGYGQSTADRSDILNITKNGVLQLYNPSYPSTPVFQVDSDFIKSSLVNGTVIPLAMARGLPLTSTISASIFNVGVDHNAQNYYLFGSDNAYCNIWVPFRADNYSTTFKLTKAASESIGTYRLAVGVQSGYTIIFKHFNSPSDNKTIISTGSNVTGAFPQGAGTSGYYDYDSFYMGASDKNTHIYFKSVPSDSEITFVIDNVSKIFSMIKGGWL